MADRKVYPLRVDRRLYDALERWAADDLRSVNAQIEFLLRESLRRAGRLPPDPTGAPPWGSPDPSGPDPSGRDRAGPDG
jgi:hypothetical protein